MPEESKAPQTPFVWHEVMVPDLEAAKEFYSKVFGWDTKLWEQGDMKYTMFSAGGKDIAGVMELKGPELENVPPHWLTYVGTDDVDATCTKIKEIGGSVKHGPEDIPTVGRFAVVADPGGAVFAVFKGGEG